MSTTRESIPTPDGTMAAILARPSVGGPFPPVVLLMDAFGLRDAMAEMAERARGLERRGGLTCLGACGTRRGAPSGAGPRASRSRGRGSSSMPGPVGIGVGVGCGVRAAAGAEAEAFNAPVISHDPQPRPQPRPGTRPRPSTGHSKGDTRV